MSIITSLNKYRDNLSKIIFIFLLFIFAGLEVYSGSAKEESVQEFKKVDNKEVIGQRDRDDDKQDLSKPIRIGYFDGVKNQYFLSDLYQ